MGLSTEVRDYQGTGTMRATPGLLDQPGRTMPYGGRLVAGLIPALGPPWQGACSLRPS